MRVLIEFTKIRGKDKNSVSKIFLGNIILSIFIIILSLVISLEGIVKTIVISLLGIIHLGAIISIILIIKRKEPKNNEKFEIKNDPIMTYYIKENKIECTEGLIFAELNDLYRRDYIEIIEENGVKVYRLKENNQFIRMDGLENINNEQIKKYTTEDIPAYENLFVTKILFPFANEITEKEISNKINDNYFKDRFELCQYILEKMLIYALEEKQLIISENSINNFTVILILNIIASVIEFAMVFSFNIFFIISIILSIAVTSLILKKEKIFSYKFTEEMDEYVEDLDNYIEKIKKKNENELTEEEKNIKILFN